MTQTRPTCLAPLLRPKNGVTTQDQLGPTSVVSRHKIGCRDLAAKNPCGRALALPRARSYPNDESELKPGDAWFISFCYRVIKFSFLKNVTTRIPDPTQMADPNWSPVYFDVFIYLNKTFYYFILLRKRFQFWASP